MCEMMCMQVTTIFVNTDILHFPSTFQTNFNIKMTNMELNQMANLNMNVLRILSQIIHYITGKQV